ncbi:coiled-coil domain-containing protein 96 [Eublepharis macularius]|uniref:Coiled-coil domain-containing protein 96 n=1 Tax=Eublepharis macularius TaxID=481883 RepID=A0AA97JPK4_EUBMA|nr:coiled-coil domain-containing protein 96 [Eublepharis macularius]
MEAEVAEPAPAEPEEAAPPEPGDAASVQASPEEPLPLMEEAEEGPAGNGEEAAGMTEEAAQGLAEEPEGAAGEAEIEEGEPEGGPAETEAEAEALGVAAASFASEAGSVEGAPSMGSLLAGPLPTSAAFEEGEPLEPPPLQVSEQLARRISLSLWELERQGSPERLEPGSSPDEQEEEEESEEDAAARRAEEQRQRAELVEQYRQLVLERGRLRHYSARLQSKLADALNKAKGKERARPELEQHISDKEQRYNRYLAMLQELRNQQQEEMAWYQQQMEALQQACEEKQAVVNSQWKAYQATKKEVAVYTMGRRLGGRQAAIQKVDQIQSREESKEKEMTEVRLENIKLKHRILKLEASLKAQEQLAEGLHLIDFEQLKIENQTYNEKIEERNEELQKLRRKITNTVQILTQVKEKLQFVEAENQGQKAQLLAVEALLAQKREVLTRIKQARDRLRIDNEKLHQKCGLLGDTLLLRDFEEKVNVAEVLKQRLEALKRQHAGLTLTCNGVKKKIRGIKSFLPL